MPTLSNDLSESEIHRWASALEGKSVEEILRHAFERFGSKLVMTSNFGAEGVVALDHLRRVAPRVPVVYLDTGFQFPETDRIKEQLTKLFDLNLVEYRSELSVDEQARLHGEQLYERDPGLCCNLRKVEPLGRALADYAGWIAALRRDQSPTRALIRVVEWNARYGLVKFNPLAGWTRREVWDYLQKHKLPYNRLYDEGYTSVGCAPCTRPVVAGAHERSGRWDGATKLECGIHL